MIGGWLSFNDSYNLFFIKKMEKAHLSLLFASSKSTRKSSLRQASLNEFCFDQAKHSRAQGSIWLEEWNDGKYLVFSLVCLVGGVEKWKDEKLFCLVGEKKGKDGKCNLYKLTIIPLLHNM